MTYSRYADSVGLGEIDRERWWTESERERDRWIERDGGERERD